MSKIFPILIALILCLTSTKDAFLDNIEVIGGNYGNYFVFLLTGKSYGEIAFEQNIKMKIIADKKEKESMCTFHRVQTEKYFSYFCVLNEKINNGKIFLKKNQENKIFTISKDIQIVPKNIDIKYLNIRNLKFNNNRWNFDLETEIYENILPETLIYANIEVDNSKAIAGCLFASKGINNALFKCKLNMPNQNSFQKLSLPTKAISKKFLSFNRKLSEDEENNIITKSLNFVKGYNLIYNSEEKWEFYINTNSEDLPINSRGIIDILYNELSSTATCLVIAPTTLKCSPDSDMQSQFDLIKISNIKSDKSTISWNDLTHIYEIPYTITLEYLRLYDLAKLEKNYHFKILLKENLLPENAMVIVDILAGSKEEENSATCYNSNQILNCKVDSTAYSLSNLIQLSTIKKYGSVEWLNPKKSDKIEYITTLNYKNSYYLDFIDNKWKFELKADTNISIAASTLVIINIKYGPEKKLGKAKCIIQRYNSLYFDCEADYENQNINDLILITNKTTDLCISWKNAADELHITRLASLNLIRAYNLEYTNKKWSFLLQVNEDLPSGTKLIADIAYTLSGSADTATCSYNNKIVSCIRDDSTQDRTDLIRLRKEKRSGSITWLNIKEDFVQIPLTTTLTYNKAYGLFFSDVFNFIIEAVSVDYSIPSSSFVIIDILQNNLQATANCILHGGSKGKLSNLTCSSLAENQHESDTIKLNHIKLYSTVTWNSLSQTNNAISTANTKTLSLAFIDAYDMTFSNNTWIFKVKGKPTTTIYGGDIYTIDIKYSSTNGFFDSIATCWTDGGTKTDGIIFLCKCNYDEQNENDLVQIKYPKTAQSSITWTTGISENHYIVLKTSLVLVKAYDLYYESAWKFKLEVKDGLLPPGSKVIIDLYKTKDLVTTNCTSLTNNLILCNTVITTSNAKLKLAEEKSKSSSIEWKSNLQNDYLFFVRAVLSFEKTYNIYFDENEKKWNFQLSKKSGKLDTNSKIIIDILYDNNPSTASCYFYDPKINCTVDGLNQDKTKLVKLSHIKTDKSTVTWDNLDEDKFFYLECHLTYLKSGKLKYENSQWVFDVYIENNEDIPNYSNVIIDIKESNFNGIAYCVIIDDKLNCNSQTYESYLISLNWEKSQISTVVWDNTEHNLQDEFFTIESSLSYISSEKIIFSENKYTFKIKYSGTYIPPNGIAILDILVGTSPKTSKCIGNYNNELLCEIKEEDYTTPFVYISKTKSEESTITWLNLDSNKSLINIQLGFYAAYNKELSGNKCTFQILTYQNKLPDDIQINIVVRNLNIEEFKTGREIPCVSRKDILYCTIDINEEINNNENFELYLPKNDSTDVNWLNGINGYVNISPELIINYSRMNSFEYNKEKKYYYFSLIINSDKDIINEFYIMDISINDENAWAKCNLNSANEKLILSCFTKEVDYNSNDEIKIPVNKNYGNIKWNNLDNDLIISDIYLAEIDKKFDLYFDDNKWKFKIKLAQIITLEKNKKLDILISGQKGFATCQLTKGILSCEVDSEAQNNLQLIQLSENNAFGSIQLTNINNNINIPLKASLEFIKANNLKYNNENRSWSFNIEAKINKNIPTNSIFTVDIKYQKELNIENDIAYCSYNANDNDNNIIKLLCKPEKEIDKDKLITINKNKSEYSSITWSNEISEKKLEIILSAELNVLKAYNLKFESDNNKWSFQLDLGNDEFPLNSNFIIDIIYEQKDATALCTFKNGNYLLCYPEIDKQNENDFFDVSYTKKSGTVTYINSPDTLEFLIYAKMKFEKSYDLLYNEKGKWEFKIKVSECSIPKGRSIFLDVKIDYQSGLAKCSLNDDILLCEVISENQNEYNEIKLLNNKNNEYVDWENFENDVQNIYSKIIIKFIHAYGGFYDNKWKIYIKSEFINPSQLSNKVLLDIKVNNKESTAICEEYYYYKYLICESTHEMQSKSDIIEIEGSANPNLGSVYWEKPLTNEQRKINGLNLNINYDSFTKYSNNDNLYFYISGNTYEESEFEIIENSEVEIEVLINKTNGIIEMTNSICLTNDISTNEGSYVYLTCSLENINDVNDAYININSKGNSKDINFQNQKENIRIYQKTSDEYEDPEKSSENYGKYLGIIYSLLFILILY